MQTGQNKSGAGIKLLQTRAPGNEPDSRMSGQQVRPASRLSRSHDKGANSTHGQERANRETKSAIQPARAPVSFTEDFWELICPPESGSFNRCETWKLIVEGFQGPLQENNHSGSFQIQ